MERLQREFTITLLINSSELKMNQRAEIFFYDEMVEEWRSIGGTLEGNRLSVVSDHIGVFAVFSVNVVDETVLAFADTKGHWAEASIHEAISKGIVKGYEDGTFKPNQSVSRAEFIVMLMNGLMQ